MFSNTRSHLQKLFLVYDNEKENWKVLTKKEIYAILKKTHHNRDNKFT
jgi:hypothetical protein